MTASATDWSPGGGLRRREVTVGATRTGSLNVRAKSLGRAESGLKGFRAGLAHIKGEWDPLHRCQQ